MARIAVAGADVVVRLHRWERVAARRARVRVPVSALREVYVEPDWWRALRGGHGSGLCVPDLLCMGTRRLVDGEDFVVVRAGRPVLCLDLRRTARYGRIAVCDPDPDRACRTLRDRLPRDRPA
ncbi:hypothetical protein GCM10018793_30110 [Streptomyces sulfonofaciens]|uniref:Uncharacterized protein n=1 Tax=Streptomyces sulfonofaciens TaxID=68272 RepID=A0A919G626_9ACTN|nr:hypothetical protein [Streptomyces sulfonofaciens]GHH78767.1 hypothetical protein GCM10018793_30110 [Streptomyces sulfonofaciens]